jgi:hypothetical protein
VKIAEGVSVAAAGIPGMVVGCPVCRSEQVRPVRLRCNPAGSMAAEVMIDADGLHVNKSAPLCHDVAIVLEMRCDHGHAFLWMFCLLDGQTVMVAAQNPPRCPEKAIWAA